MARIVMAIAAAPTRWRKAWRKWRAKCALRASQRDCDVLKEHIDFFQQELAREHRRQIRLSNAIKDLK